MTARASSLPMRADRRAYARRREKSRRFFISLCLLIVSACAPSERETAQPADAVETLAFSIADGRVRNDFLRAGPVAAHLVLTSGHAPRLVVAFPAGNSGAGLWFAAGESEARWRVTAPMRAAAATTPEGAALYGVETELALDGPPLVIDRAIVGSVRSIRDYGYTGRVPAAIEVAPRLDDRRLVWARPRLDGEGGYRLSLEILDGDIAREGGGAIRLMPSADGTIRLKVAAFTGDAPLTPIPEAALLTRDAAADPGARAALAFLSYEEKLLAGSWRFLTYFGRDTLLSLKLLAPAARPALMEAGLAAVLERLGPDGAVAHEEDIADFAALRRLKAGGEAGAAAIYDYAMIDDDFLLAPVAADYLLGAGRTRAAPFLERRAANGDAYGALLVRNLAFVAAASRPFAAAPERGNLIRLKEGKYAGEWRDSEEGLGGGRIPYNVNAALVPAALDAASRLAESGLLDAWLNDAALGDAGRMAGVWAARAPDMFRIEIDAAQARERAGAYAARIGVPFAPESVDGAVIFSAVALDASGAPIPVLHSDEGFLLAFRDPPAREVARAVEATMRPFPAGLMTPAGLLVANAAYAPAAAQDDFSNRRYHGAVVWSWQQALMAAGFERQLARSDLDDALRARLETARAGLWRAIESAEAVKTAELWSWSIRDGAYVIEPFGQRDGDATEANAAQLWSTVYLALKRPPAAD